MAGFSFSVGFEVGEAGKLDAPNVERTNRHKGNLSQRAVLDQEGQPFISDEEAWNRS
jgi:hypothetical protein